MADDHSISVSSSTAPLLRPRQQTTTTTALRSNAIALLLNRAVAGASGRPSNLVRETAALQLEERRADWGYSKPVVALDIAWNLAFTLVSVGMLCATIDERPNTPVRVWIGGYALQCLVHVGLVWVEYRRRSRRGRGRSANGGNGSNSSNNLEAGLRVAGSSSSSSSSSSDSDVNDSEAEEDDQSGDSRSNMSSIAKRCESLNTMTSFVWWIVGFYWIVSGGDFLLHNAPRLYWLAVVFLAFDVFFAVFCIALACMIGIALCCCLPCIIAILYAIAGQEGATESDLSVLPKYRYQICGDVEKSSAGTGSMVPVSGDLAEERVLLPEDAECCICLCPYEDGAELHALPCGHNFHASCIVKWLKINASCPLCKYNILKGNNGQL